MVAIEIDKISKKFRKYTKREISTIKDLFVKGIFRKATFETETFWALRDVSFTVKKGKMVGIIGSNGSGKSTLLRLLAGIMVPTSGSIKVNGRVSALIELGAGFHPELSGRENIFINGIILGLSKKDIKDRFDGIVKFAGLEDFIDSPVKTYSSGMYMRLGFAIAINVDPDILLIDEILAVGDEEFQHKCLNKINEFKRKGKTLVFVSHDLGSVERLCDEVVWIENGILMARGNSRMVIDKYTEYVASFEEERAFEHHQRVLEELKKDSPNRWGTGEVEITSVKFMDGNNKERYLYNSGEEVTVSINYKAYKQVKDLVCGIAIIRDDGLWCFGTNTKIEQINLKEFNGNGQATIRFKNLNLIEGKYFVDVAVRSKEGSWYDYHSQGYSFTIVSKIKDVGVFRPDHEWTFSEEFKFSIGDSKNEDSELDLEHLDINSKSDYNNTHVIICVLDAAVADHLSSYGYRFNTTPNIDKLAKEGILFENAFSQASYTLASVASLFVGLYPESHKVIHNINKLPDNLLTIPEIFKQNGFKTAAFSANPFISKQFGFERGFEQFIEVHKEYDVTTENVVHIPADAITKKALVWLKENMKNNSFLYLHYLQPHNPYSPPKPFDKQFDADYAGTINASTSTLLAIDEGKITISDEDIQHIVSLYDGNLAYIDHEIGKLILNLKELDVYDNSIFILLSDHGEAFGEHGRYLHNTTVYDEMIKIPLIIKLPKHFKNEGKKVPHLVELIDIAPMLCHILGINISNATFQGRSIYDLLSGKYIDSWKEYIYARTIGEKPAYTVRGKRYKYILNPDNSEELYDLEIDNKEKFNIINDKRELAKTFHLKLKDWLATQNMCDVKSSEASHDKEIEKKLKALGYM